MKVIMENGSYRIIESIGRFFNKRYELQKLYHYYDSNGNRIESYSLKACHGTNLKWLVEVMERHIKEDMKPKETETFLLWF